MPEVIGKIPEFTSEGEATPEEEGTVEEESSSEVPQETGEKETETPAVQPPTEKQPAGESETPPSDDAGSLSQKQEIENQIRGLEEYRKFLLKDIKDLRGDKREIRQEQVQKIEEKLEDLQDIHPEDVSKVDKILRSKGYLSKDDVQKILYENTINDVRDAFLESHPEYKPENDPGDIRWSGLKAEFSLYRLPDNPKQVRELLERAHQAISLKSNGGRRTGATEVEKKTKQLATAGLGGSGAQRSTPPKSFTPEQLQAYRAGGWSEEEIKEMEKRLT